MLDLEEREGSLGGGGNKDLTNKLSPIVLGVGVSVLEGDLSTRVRSISALTVRKIVGESPEVLFTSTKLEVS